ncbi:hypothetical protein VKI21_01290 [Cyanobacterium aponinum UTEX 3222]|uniref:Uncharacterized protein n=2 Tax=Cyanobacterium TaxID=102234 RepID=K9YZ91_CYAAP|nr:hypothetical protein [Cyanobacterium aponinum]AFZ52219.1 hypothetical protein Cyan10605_0058 [Cyanobacterium aponinum PCC 10605]WRL42346.1 hypothetical protein VKI21_01290 [Cyanobacterium aponinum UTEX 3222]
MFSKNNPDKNPMATSEIENLTNENNEDLFDTELEEIDSPPLVKLVEKISGILSPYFIVIVGLYLYDNNFLFGSILILIGVLSLLKISYEDVLAWIEKIKGMFKS